MIATSRTKATIRDTAPGNNQGRDFVATPNTDVGEYLKDITYFEVERLQKPWRSASNFTPASSLTTNTNAKLAW